MRARYPDAEGFVERDGVKVGYEMFGSGEPAIVFAPTDPARRSSTCATLTDPAGPDLPTCTSYRRRSPRARRAAPRPGQSPDCPAWARSGRRWP